MFENSERVWLGNLYNVTCKIVEISMLRFNRLIYQCLSGLIIFNSWTFNCQGLSMFWVEHFNMSKSDQLTKIDDHKGSI